VQLIDCDVEEPNDHLFIKPDIDFKQSVSVPVPEVDEKKCTHCGKCGEVCAFHAITVLGEYVLTFPELCHGCGACSYLCPERAITEIPHELGMIETGQAEGISFVHGKLSVGQAMAPPIIRKVKDLISKERTVVIDASPGTSCPVVEAIKGSDFCLLVTEPTPFGLNDLKLAVAMVRQLDIPCGIVLNRAGVGDGATEVYCRKETIPILLTIPLDTHIANLYSRGIPLVKGMPDYEKKFIELYDRIGEMVDAGNCRHQR
jgi:MinD superfamily P-loop ATPase